ncbi:hypothetical protein ABZ942_36985 [Nocardia sp. NPDC046473]|uniref:hypothetical protein n=1 Tax=Nocardia sp. NPDC046473 TaxID=3155733 RepID=UPI0033E5E722
MTNPQPAPWPPTPPHGQDNPIRMRLVPCAEPWQHPVSTALMPIVPGRTGMRGLTSAATLLGGSATVVGVYVGLPLVLVTHDILHSLPAAAAATAAMLMVAATGIGTVLTRTTGR